MAVAPALVDLGILLALVVLVGLSYAYRYTLGALLQTLVAALNSVRLPSIGPIGGGRVFGFLADELDKIDHAIRHALGRGVSDMQAAWNTAASYTAHAVGWIGREIASLSHDTAQAVEGLAQAQVPRWITRRLAAALAAIAALKARVLALEHAGVKRIERVTHVVTHRVKVIERAVVVPTVGAIPRTIPKVPALERDAAAVGARLRDLVKRLGPAALLGTLVAAIGRLGFGWVRCAKVGRAGRQICGMNEDLLQSLLADTLLIAGTISLVEFAEGMQGIVSESVAPIRAFWRAT